MRWPSALLAATVMISLGASAALADPKIVEEPIGPNGKWAGFALSRQGVHVAMLNSKGSRFIVSVDGVEGPRIDGLIGLDGNPFIAGNSNSGPNGGLIQVPIIFSDDGAHCAYLAKSGDDYILVLDGKELVRAKFQSAALSYGALTFTTGGKHLYYGEIGPGGGGYHIVMDGKPGPDSHTPPKVVTSPDGVHYAYVGTQRDGNDTPWAVVDGKQVKYFGDDLQFNAAGHLFALLKGKGEMALNVDGKNVIVANNITQLHLSPTGGEIAATVYTAKTGKTVLTINGKAVPETEGSLVQNVYFSPDDKHYAAVCSSAGTGAFVIIDGKKGEKYNAINGGQGSILNMSSAARAWALGHSPAGQVLSDAATMNLPGFTANSSRFLYVAQIGLKSFLVANDDESDGYLGIAPVISPDGKHVAYLGTNNGAVTVVIDGKTVPIDSHSSNTARVICGLAYTPDSQHWVFTNNAKVYVDGAEQKGSVCQSGQYLYSPDCQHLLFVGNSAADPSRFGVFLDNKLVTTGPGVSSPIRPAFSPDSKHVFWIGHKPPETSSDFDNGVLYVDGQPTPLHFLDNDSLQPGNWEVGADGVLTFIARSGGDLKRFHVTPDPDSSLATMIAKAPETTGKK